MIPRNKICWVQGCESEQLEGYLVCEEHSKDVDLKLDSPKYAGNNPNIPK